MQAVRLARLGPGRHPHPSLDTTITPEVEMITRKTIWAGLVRQFGKPTGMWGALAGFIMSRRQSNRQRNDWTLDLLDIRPTDRVLELGFGPGLGIRGAAERAQRGEVFGVDHSAVMLRQASKRNAAAITAGRVKLQLASVDALPDFPAQFDKIFGVNVHMFWSDAAAVIAELLVLLQPGGTLALTFQPRKPGATNADTAQAADKLTKLLDRGGFEQVRTEVLELTPSAVCVLGSSDPAVLNG
jgi:SAM-dependent methyltransferase